MHSEPQKEHQWLQRLVGDWSYQYECVMGPDKPPETLNGTDRVRSIGGLWVVCESSGETPGGGVATSIMTLGYDPAKKRYLGTFLASMMTHLWIYEGELDPAGKKLTLSTEGPVFDAEGKYTKYKDLIEIVNDDERTLTSLMLTDDGNWQQFMQATYRRNPK